MHMCVWKVKALRAYACVCACVCALQKCTGAQRAGSGPAASAKSRLLDGAPFVRRLDYPTHHTVQRDGGTCVSELRPVLLVLLLLLTA